MQGDASRPSSLLPRQDPGAGGQSFLPEPRLGHVEPLLDALSTCGSHASGNEVACAALPPASHADQSQNRHLSPR